MGVDCIAQLPANVRAVDVGNVIGRLAGLPARRCKIGNSKSIFVEVPGVSVKPGSSNAPEYAHIVVAPPPGVASICAPLRVSYSFEGDGGCRKLMHRSRPIWLAIFRRLVNFFGGKLDYSDFDDIECDHYVPPKPNAENCPNTGAEWEALQLRILNLPALTEADIEAERENAYYKD